jgi:uncharacterized protein YutE (UPF0331/DUF86 family)
MDSLLKELILIAEKLNSKDFSEEELYKSQKMIKKLKNIINCDYYKIDTDIIKRVNKCSIIFVF